MYIADAFAQLNKIILLSHCSLTVPASSFTTAICCHVFVISGRVILAVHALLTNGSGAPNAAVPSCKRITAASSYNDSSATAVTEQQQKKKQIKAT
jgi:hypothetical protein